MTLGGKIFLGGAALAAAGLGLALASGSFIPNASQLLAPSRIGPLAAGVAVAIVGCFVYVLQPAFDRAVARRVPIATLRTSLAMLIAAVAVANLVSLPVLLAGGRGVGAGGPGQLALGPVGLAYLIAASELPIIGVVWLRIVLPGCLSWQELGLRGAPWAAHVRTGLIGGGALFLAAEVVGALLTAAGIRQNQLERFEGVAGAPPGLFVIALLAGCLLAPFAEELFFRGYLFQSFSRRHGALLAYVVSAGLFAIVHANLAAAVPIFILGLMLAWIFQRTGSIVPGAIAHGVNNAIAFVLLYLHIQ